MTEPLAVTPAKAAELVGVPERTIRALIRRGELGAVRYGAGRLKARYLVPIDALRAWIDEHRIGPRSTAPADSVSTLSEGVERKPRPIKASSGLRSRCT